MTNAIFTLPDAYNEPSVSYAPGTPERALLKAELERQYAQQLDIPLIIGGREVRLITANIHSDDATVLWLPDAGLLLAGDTVEDTVTYVGDPEAFATHLTGLARLAALSPRAVLPNHGAPDRIAAGGYGPDLIDATAGYIRWLMHLRDDPAPADLPLTTVIAAPLAAGTLGYFAPYEAIHQQNVARVLALGKGSNA